MEKINTLIQKAVNFREFLEKHKNKASILATIVVMQVIVLGNFAMVSAQDEVTIDVNGTYENDAKISEVLTGDAQQNNLSLQVTKMDSGLVVANAGLYGTDQAGPDSRRRGEELGLSESTRSGMIQNVDSEVTALIVNSPTISIHDHLARQFVPGAEGSGTAVVYAQGEGYTFLKDDMALEEVWAMFRDIAYAGYVIVIIIAGFMIMFRSKIGGQVTVNVMNALPGIIVGLILVTFSFAIAGFILDLGKLGMLLVAQLMDSNLSSSNFEIVGLGGPLTMTKQAFELTRPGGYDELLRGAGLIGAGALASFLGPIGPLLGGAGVVAGFSQLIIAAVVGAISLYAGIKVFFTLIMTYVKLFLDIILGPIYILIGSLPGYRWWMTEWIKRLSANVLVFILIFFIINLARYIGYSSVAESPLDFFNAQGDWVTDNIIKMRGVFVLAGYFIAAGAPAIATDLLQVRPSKGVDAAIEGAKGSAGKIPIIGGFFG